MRIAVAGTAGSPRIAALAEDVLSCARRAGHEPGGDASGARLVLNLTRTGDPRSHWTREGTHQFGASIVELPSSIRSAAPAAEILALAYPVLIRTLSNAVVALTGDGSVLVTPELGVRPLPAGAPAVLEALVPLAQATFAIENEVREDLDPRLGAAPLAELADGGRQLAALGLLPSVVRLHELLSPDDLKLLRAIYGLQQISYGNLSIREPSGGFWMTGRGADKSRIEVLGRDVLLVTGHDAARGLLRCSVPEGRGGSRVSVDALEHALLYESFPRIGAIVHAHAWIDGIDSTGQNWPCGTWELARDVRDLAGRQPDPARAEIGLRNHGVTLTGPSLADIFARTEGRLHREVPPA